MDETRLLEQLRTAGTAWTTAQGVWRHWRRQDLVRVAFDRHFDRPRMQGEHWTTLTFVGPDGAAAGDEPAEPVIESVWAVSVDRPPRRMRVELLRRCGEELRPDVVVWVGDTFWARTGGAVLTNHGDVGRVHGGNEVLALLQPDYVAALYHLTVVGESQVTGRSCCRVAAREREGVTERERYDVRGDPFGMVAGGEDFVLDVDPVTGLLMRATKLVDGEVAEIVEWTELTLDTPVEDVLFAPLAEG
jgi:hypothetical protein